MTVTFGKTNSKSISSGFQRWADAPDRIHVTFEKQNKQGQKIEMSNEDA
jgi:hypothetical protein